jgi:DNA-binding FrmR family transcriptional regulator
MLDRMAEEDGKAAPGAQVAEAPEERCGPEPCDGLLTQLLAVRAAVEQVGVIIMELHLQHCVLSDLPEDEERMRNLREALKLWTRLSSG